MDEHVVGPAPGEPHKPIILLVEDEVLVRLTTAEILRDAGYDVVEAANGSEAIAILATGHPLNLVLTDIRMPGDVDGLKLTRMVKDRRPNLPVAILTSHLSDGIAHGADRFIFKPFQVEQLVETVRELVGTDRLVRQTRPSAS